MNAREPSNFQGLRIGITIGLYGTADNMRSDIIRRSATALARLFSSSPRQHEVFLVDTGAAPLPATLPWDIAQFRTVSFDAVCDELDVLFELGEQIDVRQRAHLKDRGARRVRYCCAGDMQAMEAILFDQPCDQVWMIPQVALCCPELPESLRRQPTRVVPLIWDPMYVERSTAQLPHEGEYRPGTTPKRIAVMASEGETTSSCVYPLLIGEAAYRASPELFGQLDVSHTVHTQCISLMRKLELVLDGKVSFGQAQGAEFQPHAADIVISRGRALSHACLDVCWKGYPLIHSAGMCTQIGYFYPADDLGRGAQLLQYVLEAHDNLWSSWRVRQRRHIEQYLATNPALVRIYDQLLCQLLDRLPEQQPVLW